MAKNQQFEGVEKFNRVSGTTNVTLNVLFFILAAICVIPVLFVIIISLSSEQSIAQNGYQFFPKEWSMESYEFLWKSKNMIGKALGVSVLVTGIGTLVGVLLTTSMGYVISRPSYRLKGFLTMIVFIPMIFNGGLVSSYFINSTFLNLSETIWALILPMAVSSFNVVICKTFFKSTIPDSIIESAKIDGAAQLRIFFGIVLPISLPLIATIALFLCFGYWNDWWLSMLYITDRNMFSLQALLMAIEKNIEFMSQNSAMLGISQAEMAASMPKESFRMAIAVVVILPIACAYPFFQKYFISGLTIGAVKG